MKKTILILLHKNEEDFLSSSFTIRFLKTEWERLGLVVKVAYGTDDEIKADIVINHVDLSVVPDEYINFLNRYPVVLNQKVRDISKTIFSENIIYRNSRYPGKVILKTNANYGGEKERLLRKGDQTAFSLYERICSRFNAFLKNYTWWNVKTIKSKNYPVFDSVQDLPRGVWKNKHLIVEKFIPEIDPGGKYRLRAWSFLGDRSLNVLTTASTPIIKGSTIEKREILSDAVPEKLIRIRRQLGFDYGRFDYVLLNGEAVLYDVNRTPTTSSKALETYAHELKDLAKGIFCF